MADQSGNRSTATVRVHVQAANDHAPTAEITNAPRTSESPGVDPNYQDNIPIVREKSLGISGEANDLDPNDYFEYTLSLIRLANDPDDPLTKQGILLSSTRYFSKVVKVNGQGKPLGTLDLSTLPNGAYTVQLDVIGGARTGTAQMRFLLESGIKLGDFTFSVEDLNIPVDGIPLQVIRTYSSLAANAQRGGDFGFGWTYALVDIDAELDEIREAEEDTLTHDWFSKRVNPANGVLSGRNMTLNLPDGRRTTFYFTPSAGTGKTYAEWKAIAGTGAKLAGLLSPGCSTPDTKDFIDAATLKWQCSGNSGLDSYDFYGFVLTTADGYTYKLNREDLGAHDYIGVSASDIHVNAYGKIYVSEITSPSGEKVQITPDRQRIKAVAPNGTTVRRQFYVAREEGRISAIYDPMAVDSSGNPNGPAALLYDYDDNGNLMQVRQRTKNVSGNASYIETKYYYEDPSRPHFLTTIIGPRGKRVIQNSYDEKGRLKSQLDGAGVTVTYDYDLAVSGTEQDHANNQLTGKIVKSVVVNRGLPDEQAQQSISGYDSQGNIVYQKTYDGLETGYSYDAHGTMTEQRRYFSDGTYHPTSYTPSYATDGSTSIEYLQALTTILPHENGANVADFTVTETFSPAGDTLKTVRPSGGVQIQTLDTQGRFSKLYYNQDGSGNPTGATLMEQTYPANGVGVGTEKTLVGKKPDGSPVYSTFSSDNTTLYSTGTFTSTDPSGRTLSSIFDTNLRLTSLTTDRGTSTSTYDDLDRETQNVFAGITTSFNYETTPEWTSASSSTLGTIARTIDDAGRLAGWTPPTGRPTSYEYDERGRLVSETDGAGSLSARRFEGNIDYARHQGSAEVTTTKDDLGRLSERSSHEFGRETYDYYPDGRLKAVHHQIHSLFGNSHSPAFSGQPFQPDVADWDFSYPIIRTDASPSKTHVTDSLGRLSIQEFSKEGLLKSASGNSCCGTVQYSYLLDNPELDAEDYPTLITDAANRVRSFSYYLDVSVDGNIGQLQQATELANSTSTPRNYTFQYFKPDVSPFTTQLKAVTGPSSSAATGRQTLIQYTYDNNERLINTTITGLSGTHDGLTGTRSVTYGTTTQGATHLASKITSPNGVKTELAYEPGTGRVQTKYLERSSQTSANAEERISHFYDANDSMIRTEQVNTVLSSTRTDVIKILKGRPVSIGTGNVVLADNHQFQAGDPVQFASTGTLPTGLSIGTIYYVYNPIASGFQVVTSPTSSTPVSISQNATGILSASDGPGWAAFAQSEINSGVTRNRAELIHRTWPVGSEYDGWYEEVGVRALSNGSSTKTYVSKYSFNSRRQLQIIDVYVQTGFTTPPARKFRFEFVRDAAGRLLSRAAFKASATFPEDNDQLTLMLESLYTYYTNADGSAKNGDWVQSIEHRKYVSGSPVILEKVTYERTVTGEPTKVTWNDGTFVTVGYNSAQGLRVMSEDFSAGAGVENTYTYHDSGNRGSLNGSSWSYNSGYQLAGQNGKTYGYDGNGNLSSFVVSPTTSTMSYTVDDHLATYQSSSSSVSYYYDAFRRRNKSVDNQVGTRRFVRGPSPGSDLDVLHMITDDNDAAKCVYVYAGSQPLMRFTVDGSGNPTNPIFYLEDAVGSVLGLADQNGTLTARFRYDGFGNARTGTGLSDPSTSAYIPAGSGGDFRFQGAWLETVSALYHMRARDYDPETGRFIERDPEDPNPQGPETYNPYIFANSNPYYFSDPSGAFTVVEINISSALQQGLQGIRTIAIQKAKNDAKDKIFDLFGKLAQDSLELIYPGSGSILAMFADTAFAAGVKHERDVIRAVCNKLPVFLRDDLWLGPLIRDDGTPLDSGFGCGLRHLVIQRGSGRGGEARPDFVFGPTAPADLPYGGYGKEYLLGDLKLSGNSLYNQYVEGNKQSQFHAIGHFAGRYTQSHTAIFLTIWRGNRGHYEQVKRLMRDSGFRDGVVFIVFSAKK